jgi:plasmid stabilization system protein ParE
MTYRVIIQPKAEQDIRAAALWILEQSKSADTAVRWARRVRAKINTLKTRALLCPIDPDSDAYGVEVRILLFGNRHNKLELSA